MIRGNVAKLSYCRSTLWIIHISVWQRGFIQHTTAYRWMYGKKMPSLVRRWLSVWQKLPQPMLIFWESYPWEDTVKTLNFNLNARIFLQAYEFEMSSAKFPSSIADLIVPRLGFQSMILLFPFKQMCYATFDIEINRTAFYRLLPSSVFERVKWKISYTI